MPKTFIILRGLPGSGKTTWALQQPRALIVSADHFFATDGVYRFDPRLLPLAHSHCRIAFRQAVCAEVPLIILDNTNVKLEHFKEYAELAYAAGYEVEVREFRCTIAEAVARNAHYVPPDAIERMWQQWEPTPEWMQVTSGGVGGAPVKPHPPIDEDVSCDKCGHFDEEGDRVFLFDDGDAHGFAQGDFLCDNDDHCRRRCSIRSERGA